MNHYLNHDVQLVVLHQEYKVLALVLAREGLSNNIHGSGHNSGRDGGDEGSIHTREHHNDRF